ncbi:sulfotransferase family 2 domain-containing protein [Psychromonas arctica]|uniref:sulfotransferase family 2 domain-containing protein n=1 Tax=Psychromonas arctica TaxID=168275 RepID=UPI002FD50362
MSFTVRVKNNRSKTTSHFFSLIFSVPISLYKQYKSKQKVTKMKRKLKGNGISYANKILFNETNEKLLFIHIPKAAGMSVVKALYNQNRSHHASATDYKKEDEIKFSQAFSFAITRNPYTRLHSAYNYLKSGGMNNIDRAWWELYLAKYDSFESFIIEGGLNYAVENKAEHFIPQYKFVFDDDNNLLCNYLGKIEKLNETEILLTKKLQKQVTFSHRNAVSKSSVDLDDIYTLKMLEIVNQCYQKDFSLLGYDTR